MSARLRHEYTHARVHASMQFLSQPPILDREKKKPTHTREETILVGGVCYVSLSPSLSLSHTLSCMCPGWRRGRCGRELKQNTKFFPSPICPVTQANLSRPSKIGQTRMPHHTHTHTHTHLLSPSPISLPPIPPLHSLYILPNPGAELGGEGMIGIDGGTRWGGGKREGG